MNTNTATPLTSRLLKYVKTCFSSPHSAGRSDPRDPQDPDAQDRQGPLANTPQDPVTKEHILQEIRRTAEANGGRPLGRRSFLRETGIRQADWLGKCWARWNDAVREAGYTPNQPSARYEDAFLFRKFIELTRSLGRIPAQGDLLMRARADVAFPDPTVYERFGSKASFLQKLAEHCRGCGGLEDVVLLCERHLARISSFRRKPSPNAPQVGFVYLMKSGKIYKIGRSNAVGRREYDLGLQLPEPLISVHVIPTDDPLGIEAYWHKRFATKRRNGEWFDLDPADVSAFQRRKFM